LIPEILRQILVEQQNLAQVAQLHKAGKSMGGEVMEEGYNITHKIHIRFMSMEFEWKPLIYMM